MLHDKQGLFHLADLLICRGVHQLVVSPGSRNAPVITTLCNRPEMTCYTVVDERSAAFFALGIAQQSGKPVAICCTSGSAALNYAPAIAEAYYQRVPLIVLTADRPAEWIDQGDGQTIKQQQIFANYIRKSVVVPQTIHTADDLWYNDRLVAEAINASIYPVPGPVHINLPFTEPLYGFNTEMGVPAKDISIAAVQNHLTEETIQQLSNTWNNSPRKMILVGQMPPSALIQSQLETLSQDPSVTILCETTSNVFSSSFIGCIDRCLSAIAGAELPDYSPELLLTFGTSIVSKRIKTFLRKSAIKQHWHIDPADLHLDTYQHLTHSIPIEPSAFLNQLMVRLSTIQSDFSSRWKTASVKAKTNHAAFLANAGWCDLKIFESIVNQLPKGYDVQLANSTVVRYAQLFDYPTPHRFDANRGTSGIDGCTSTAVGASIASGLPTVLITGDLAFFYDSNALWNNHLPANLKIILIHNGGGGIFRFLDGPDQTGLLEEYFEASHRTSARNIALAFGLDYAEAGNAEQLKEILPHFLGSASKRAAILEISSPASESADTLRRYFKELGK